MALQIQRHKIDGIPEWIAPERDVDDAWDFDRIAAERQQLELAAKPLDDQARALENEAKQISAAIQAQDASDYADSLEAAQRRVEHLLGLALQLRDQAERGRWHILDAYYNCENRFQLGAPLSMVIDGQHVERAPREYLRQGGRPTVFQLRRLGAHALAEVTTLLADQATERLALIRAAKLGIKAIVGPPAGLVWVEDPHEPGTLAMSVIDELAPLGRMGSLLTKIGAAVLALNRPMTVAEGKP
jgi:hypothetical protein